MGIDSLNTSEDPMDLTKPCYHCGSTRFGVIDKAWFELLSDAKVKFGNVMHPDLTVVVCTGCGETRFFSKPGKDNLLELCKHEIVDVG